MYTAKATILFMFLFMQALVSYGASYPYPSLNPKGMGARYGADHLANHAYSVECDIKTEGVDIIKDHSGNPRFIRGRGYESSEVAIYWDKDKIQSVDIRVIPSAPAMENVTDPDFLKFIREVLIDHGFVPKVFWRDFLEKHLNRPLENSYYTYDFARLISSNLEIRVRFKVLRPEILQKLELRAVHGTPFSLQSKGNHKFTLDQILEILETQPLAECEEALKKMPLF